jgi:hypothetical protein
MRIAGPHMTDAEEVLSFVTRHPITPAQVLLAFANHDERAAVRLAETIRAALG